MLDNNKIIRTVAAGRTDAGVHAAAQVVHFDCAGPMPPNNWASALNGRLPKSIRIIESKQSPENWHACFSALSRRYRYNIYNARNPNIVLAPWCWHKYQYHLDENLMMQSSLELIGYHDFSAFQKKGSNRKDAFTTIKDVQIKRIGDLVQIEIEASGFLYGMVRLLVGQLVALGEHKLSPESFASRWKEAKREEIKESAPARGLCFLGARYKEPFLSKKNYFANFPEFLIQNNTPLPKP